MSCGYISRKFKKRADDIGDEFSCPLSDRTMCIINTSMVVACVFLIAYCFVWAVK